MQDETYVYSVMEACRGPTIQALLEVAGRPLEERDAAFLLQQAATTIEQLHSIGVLHRDVKPDNFMFYKYDETSPLVVIDFGLSLLLGCQADFSSKWTVGSLLYVRPLDLTVH
jgi:calcium-dependent protein kinase